MTFTFSDQTEPERGKAAGFFNEEVAAAHVEHEATIYREIGEFFFSNPSQMGTQMLVAWLTDVVHSEPERRWGALEMLALYGLSAAEASGGFPLTEQQETDLISSVVVEGALAEEYEQAAREALELLQSGRNPTDDLPDEWLIYREVLPEAYVTACLVIAVLTLESVKEVALQEGTDPAVVWRNWLTSRS